MMKQLQVEQKTYSDLIVLSLRGQLDAMTVGILSSVEDHIRASSLKYVVMDFGEIVLVDSSGIGAMVSILKYTRSKGGDTVIVNLGAQPSEVFRILNLDKAIRISDSVEQARAELEKK